MPTDDTEQREPQPRRLLRRARAAGGGFGGGSMARTESLRTEGDDERVDEIGDEPDTLIDPDAMQRNILRQTRANEAAAPSPADRMNQVALTGNEGYSKEYRLGLLHRLLIRRVPLDQIASQLRVSVSTIQKDRVALKEFLRKKAQDLNINEMIGDQLGKYDEITGMAMIIAGKASGENSIPVPMRLAAMRTALAAEADRTRFLNSAGVFDAMTFRRGEDGSDISDIQILMDKTGELIDNLIAGDLDDVVLDEAPTKRRRRKKDDGFGKFGMNDKDASSGDSETEEL